MLNFHHSARPGICCSLLLLLLLLPAVAAEGDAGKPFLHPLFSDNMVLQRDIPAPIWGWTTPGAKVTVTLEDKTAEAVADAGGKWLAKIGPLAAGGPFTLTVTGPQEVTLHNVLVGDVWLCSGQSNMQFGMVSTRNAPEEIAHADFPQIRLITVPDRPAVTPQELFSGEWRVCTPETIVKFTAVGYFFGRQLHQDLHIPIGLIHSSWGGTICEAWTSAAALQTMPDFAPEVAKLPQHDAQQGQREFTPEEYPAALADWIATNDPEPAAGPSRCMPAFDDAGWATLDLPTTWKHGALAGFRGILWLRKTIVVPEEGEGVEATLHLGAVNDSETTWFNGVKLVGRDDSKDTKKEHRYSIPGKLMKTGNNTLTIRVLNAGNEGGLLAKAKELSLEFFSPDVESIPLAGPWRYQIGVKLDKEHLLPVRADNNPNRVTVLFNGMIAPLLPFAIKGAIWYQGESNASRPRQYQTLLPTMIRDWRAHFGVGDFPFFIVSLANYLGVQTQPSEGGWAELREAQWFASQRVPNTGIAMAIDIGDAGNIHPTNKQEVGRRLALSAEAIAYGQKLVYSGPMYRDMHIEGNRIRLSFDHVGGGLMARDGGKLTGFAIAGAENNFVWADAAIDGDTLLVSSPDVPTPTAVRYDWANNPIGNLYNKEGLPAVPFRSDP